MEKHKEEQEKLLVVATILNYSIMKCIISKGDLTFMVGSNIQIPDSIICRDNMHLVEMNGKKEDFKLLVDELTTLLLMKGIGNDGEVNAVGRHIDNIIAIFSNDLWE